MTKRKIRIGSALALAGALAMAAGTFSFSAGSVVRADQPVPQPVTHQKFNFAQPILDSGGGNQSEANYKNPANPICSTGTTTAANLNTDCEGTAAHNETALAVNPTNPLNIIGSANDYQLSSNTSGTEVETAYSRAHVTFDGGKSWTTYPIDYNGYVATGDPGVAFDATGRAYLQTLGFVWSQGKGLATVPDILVAHSTDGGKTWSAPARVANGSGSDASVGVFNDKPSIAAWGNGNAIVTWTEFNDGQLGSYISSPIYSSVTHDGGSTWSAPVQISGSASFCLGSNGGTACDQDQGAVPEVAADGSIYVSFLSTRNLDSNSAAYGRDQYLVVKVDAATGKRIAGPYKVGDMYDGVYDYPYNQYGETTYHDSQFRTWGFGNIAADPTNSQHLAVVWSDMRNSQLPAPSDPYTAKTNSDIIVSQSTNGGKTWSTPQALKIRGDQFMPWSTYGTNGLLRIGYFDRSYDSANQKFGYTLSTETKYESLSFSSAQVTTQLSDPTQGDRWFSSSTVNSAFPHPSSFIGDYSGIAASPSGGSAELWTDMRNNVCFTTRCGAGEDAFFASSP